jgi:hypothetical protein
MVRKVSRSDDDSYWISAGWPGLARSSPNRSWTMKFKVLISIVLFFEDRKEQDNIMLDLSGRILQEIGITEMGHSHPPEQFPTSMVDYSTTEGQL